jgi:hypothetical protein
MIFAGEFWQLICFGRTYAPTDLSDILFPGDC